MANDKAFRVKNGLVAQRYLQSAGTETVGSVGYNLAGASYDGVSLLSSQESNPYSIVFKPDGTKLYFAGGTNDIHQFDLSTQWDLSTATFSLKSKDVSAPEGGTAYPPQDIIFSSDGSTLWVLSNRASTTEVYQWTLSTAWDVSTASYAGVKKNFTGVSNTAYTMSFNSDGTVMFIGYAGSRLGHWNLSSAYNVSTAVEDTGKRTTLTSTSTLIDMEFNADGTQLLVLSLGSDAVQGYDLSPAYDITTASLQPTSLNVSSQESSPYGLTFKNDGTKAYVVGVGSDTVYQYSTVAYTQTLDLSTGTYFSFTPSGATTVSFTNPPASGLAVAFAVEINGDGSAITWPTSVKWHMNQTPTSIASKGLYTFITTDGGTTYYGKRAAGGLA